MKRLLILLLAGTFGLAGCGDDSTTPGVDSGTSTDSGGIDSGTGTDGGDVDSGADSGTSTTGWALRSHTCSGNRTDTLWRDDDGTLFVGCGSTSAGDQGFYYSSDEGASWDSPTTTPGGFFDSWRVLDISRSADGLLYVAGNDTTSGRRVVSVDTSASPWVVAEVYNSGTTVGSAFNVGSFRRNTAGMALAESQNGTDIQYRMTDTGEWMAGNSWYASVPRGLQILQMTMYDEKFYGVGSTISQPPYLYLPKADGSFGFEIVQLATGIGEFSGEMWGIDVDAGGVVAGGVNQDRDAGMIYSGALPFDASAMNTFDVSSLYPDDSTWVRGVCRSGSTVYATGELSMKGEGFVLMSDDGGASFTDITPTVPPMTTFPPVHRCRVSSTGTLYVAGADGMFAVHSN